MILLCENGMCSVVASRSTRFAIATMCIAVSQKLTVDFFCEIKKGGKHCGEKHSLLATILPSGWWHANQFGFVYLFSSVPCCIAIHTTCGEETSQSMCKHIISSFLKRRKNVCLRDTNLFYLSN